MTRAIVLVSGGLDSATSLFLSKTKGWELCPLTFNYPLRARREIRATRDIVRELGVGRELLEVELPFLMDVEDLADTGLENPLLEGAEPTYVPARNLIIYSIAAHFAERVDAQWIVGGHNQDDSTSFPDATRRFFETFNSLLTSSLLTGEESPIKVYNPLAELSKAEVVRLALENGVPLQMTWSCSFDGEEPCGACQPCLRRAEAFSVLGIQDPLLSSS